MHVLCHGYDVVHAHVGTFVVVSIAQYHAHTIQGAEDQSWERVRKDLYYKLE